MFGSLLLATIVVDALLHRFDLVWIGRWLGIPGTILILVSFLYSMRKRKVIGFGKPKTLLNLHETFTWLGALMILVHAGVHIYTILPWLALGAVTHVGSHAALGMGRYRLLVEDAADTG